MPACAPQRFKVRRYRPGQYLAFPHALVEGDRVIVTPGPGHGAVVGDLFDINNGPGERVRFVVVALLDQYRLLLRRPSQAEADLYARRRRKAVRSHRPPRQAARNRANRA